MENLEAVVAERDKAVKLLEYGITGEPPKMTCYGGLGLRYVYHYQEHIMPWWHNPRYLDFSRNSSVMMTLELVTTFHFTSQVTLIFGEVLVK